jgi:hypothetical protein
VYVLRVKPASAWLRYSETALIDSPASRSTLAEVP